MSFTFRISTTGMRHLCSEAMSRKRPPPTRSPHHDPASQPARLPKNETHLLLFSITTTSCRHPWAFMHVCMCPERLYLPAPWARPGVDKRRPPSSVSIAAACFNTRQALQMTGFMAAAAKEPTGKYPPRSPRGAEEPKRPTGRFNQLLYRTANTIIPLKATGTTRIHGGDTASPGFTHHP